MDLSTPRTFPRIGGAGSINWMWKQTKTFEPVTIATCICFTCISARFQRRVFKTISSTCIQLLKSHLNHLHLGSCAVLLGRIPYARCWQPCVQKLGYRVVRLIKSICCNWAGISEKVIQDRSGHCTLEGLRKYERISDRDRKNVRHWQLIRIFRQLQTQLWVKTILKMFLVTVVKRTYRQVPIMLADCAKWNPPAPLQNQHSSLQVMTNSTYNQSATSHAASSAVCFIWVWLQV